MLRRLASAFAPMLLCVIASAATTIATITILIPGGHCG